MPGLEDDEANVLAEIPAGEDNARPVSEIAEDLAMTDTDPTKYKIRQIIRRLIIEHEKPIGSCSNGYFLIESRQELDAYLDDLRQRKRGIEKRIRAIRSAFSSETGPQHSLF